jgi:hypothetical protein
MVISQLFRVIFCFSWGESMPDNQLIFPLILIAGLTLLLVTGPAFGETGYQDSGPFSLNTAGLTAVGDLLSAPLVNQLSPCHPNPFNPRTTIEYRLAKMADVHLAVYCLKGRLVQTLQETKNLPAGHYEAVWNGRDNMGQTVAGGVYFCRLKAGGFMANQRMTLIK